MKAVLDTNFILIPPKFKIDIYEELKFMGYDELIVLSPVMRELKLIGDEVSKKLLEEQNYEVVEVEGNADDAIVDYAKEKKTIVCTQDKTLKNRLKALKIPVLSMRGGKVLRCV